MAKSHPVQTNFTGGEISPFMKGRVDVKKYQNGAAKIRNMVVRPQGGAFRRCGTKHITVTKKPTLKSVLVPFEFSDEQAYVLEFGEYYIHFYKDGERHFEVTTTEVEQFTVANNGGWIQLTSTAALTDLPNWPMSSLVGGTATYTDIDITSTNTTTFRTGQLVYFANTGFPASNGAATVSFPSAFFPNRIRLTGIVYNAAISGGTIYSHGLMAGDRFYVSEATEHPAISNKYCLVRSVQDYRTWTVANAPYVNSTAPTNEEAETIPIEIFTSYTETQIQELSFAQTADVLYIAHPDHPTRKLSRLSTDGDKSDWVLTEVDFQDGPYLDLNELDTINTTTPAYGSKYPDVYMEITGYTHTATVTAAVAFIAADNGKYFEYRDGDQIRLAQLSSAAGGTSLPCTIPDNVMLFMDETTKLRSRKDKPTYVAGSATNSNTNSYRSNRQAGGKGSNFQQVIDHRNTVDSTAAAGQITAQYSNTFAAADLGKYIRFGTAGATPVFHWALTDELPNTTGTKIHHAAALSTAPGMTANNATGKFIISNESRSATITAYRGSTAFSAFNTTDTGRHIRLSFGGRYVWGKFTYISASSGFINFYSDPPRDVANAANFAGNRNAANPNSGITYDWQIGAWSAHSGYPANCTFHEQRLWFGRNQLNPQNLWGSRPGSYEDMAPTEPDGTVLDDNAINRRMVSGKVSPINWLKSGAVLLVGGLGQEWQVRASSSIQEPITPTNIVTTPQTYYGSTKLVEPQSIGAGTIFVTRKGTKVRELTYNFEIDAHIATDISIMAEHLFRDTSVIDSDYQKDPINVYYTVTAEGNVPVLTYERDHEIMAWAQHEIGGSGIVESIAVSPSTSGPDYVYMLVKRTVNGSTLRTVEVIKDAFFGSVQADVEDMPFLDSYHLITPPTAITEVSGLNYFEGQVLQVLADGIYIGNKTVTAGKFTLSVAASKILVGYSYDSLLGLLPVESGAYLGTAQTKTKRVNKIGVRVEKTTSFQHGSTEAGTFQTATLPSVFYSGDKVVPLEQGYNTTGEYFIKQSLPEPLNVLLVAPELGTYEEQ